MSKAINKVVYGERTLLDLTQDTVSAETLGEGYTAHGADGQLIEGTAKLGGGATIDGYTFHINNPDRTLSITWEEEDE